MVKRIYIDLWSIVRGYYLYTNIQTRITLHRACIPFVIIIIIIRYTCILVKDILCLYSRDF